MDIFIPKIIKYQLYLLQLENYELGRYWKLLAARGFFPGRKKPLRKELVWTAKARALLTMAGSLHVLILMVLGFVILSFWPSAENLIFVLVAGAVVFLPFYFLFFSLSLILVKPLDSYLKNNLARQAHLKIENLKNLKVIGVAGSYGKTTMKEVLKQVLSIKHQVLSPSESINTPVGIARFILSKVNEKTEILILELGEHYQGDIQELCEIAKPDISVITGINEAHLERMGSLNAIISTIFEAARYAKDNALVLVNGDDRTASENFHNHMLPGQKAVIYQESSIKNPEFDQVNYGWKGQIDGAEEVFVGLMGKYVLGDVAAAFSVAKYLGLSDSEIRIGLGAIKPIEHRLQPIRSAGDVVVIDDSYNGNPAGAKEAILVLSRFVGRRKIYITPGLVETGAAAPDVHRAIGKQLAGVADVVILVKNSVTPWIEKGVKNAVIASPSASESAAISTPVKIASSSGPGMTPRNDKTQIIWFDTAQEAHAGLKDIIKPGDLVLFQNDWGDQYI